MVTLVALLTTLVVMATFLELIGDTISMVQAYELIQVDGSQYDERKVIKSLFAYRRYLA